MNSVENIVKKLRESRKVEYIDEALLPEEDRVYTSVEYTYNGDDTSDYLGHVKVNTGSVERALKAARVYAMKKHPEDDPRYFTISKDNYSNVDIIDFNGDIVKSVEESARSAEGMTIEELKAEILKYKPDYSLKGRSYGELINILKYVRSSGMSKKEAEKSIESERKRKLESTCEECGHILTDSGECPECDLHLGEAKEGKDSIAQEILVKVKDKVKEYMMSPKIGFPEDEVDDYSRVEVDFIKNDEGDEFLKIEVRAELGYVALSNLCDELNPIVSKYDKYAYFEPEQPGIIVAYLDI